MIIVIAIKTYNLSPNIFSLESLGLEVDLEYRKLNEWYEKCDAFRPWLDSTEKISKEESGTEDNTLAVKEKLKIVQVL